LIGPLFSFSWMQYQRGNLDGALAHLDRAISIANTSLAESDPARADLAETKARLLERLGRSAEAEHERSRATLLRQTRLRSNRLN
jgi:tetratricopeptide (TPR) repeat protein